MRRQSPNPIAVIQAIENVEGAIGNFIANGPSTGLQGYVRDQYRKRCDQFANAPGWAQTLSNASGGSLGRICQPWYDEQGFDGPVSQPSFTGGQCEGIGYVIDYEYNTVGTDGSTLEPPIEITGAASIAGGIPGPIQGIEDRPSGDGTILVVTYGGGLETIINSSAAVQGDFRNPRIIEARRFDGLSDECGDPPPELTPGPNPPPDPGPTPGPEPTDDPFNPTGPPILPIPDYDDPIGGPTPIVGPDPTDVGAEPDDIPGNPDTAPGGGDDVGEPIAVDPGPAGGGDETDFGEPPAGRSWVGCLLRFTFPPTVGTIAGSGPANPVSPRVVGNASLVYEGGRGDAFQVRSSSMVIVRPSGALRVTGVYVNSEPGITYTIRPLSLKNCPENICSGDE